MNKVQVCIISILSFMALCFSVYLMRNTESQPSLPNDVIVREVSRETYDLLVKDGLVDNMKETKSFSFNTLTSFTVKDMDLEVKISKSSDLSEEEVNDEYKGFSNMINEHSEAMNLLELLNATPKMLFSMSLLLFTLTSIDTMGEISFYLESNRSKKLSSSA